MNNLKIEWPNEATFIESFIKENNLDINAFCLQLAIAHAKATLKGKDLKQELECIDCQDGYEICETACIICDDCIEMDLFNKVLENINK